ncbi:MAG: thiolase family protein [Deltaproteobacteria bacterium]|nr:thiolase family protein [Deltaproteobacteria bacterium]MBW1921409.1 thiolase family protein [Deltaproteobacteria bacterium]MBW1934243.1 thiolase family protein [Deltaproteobacteria bacterium]MBW1977850.1 thiolase family protein [Deltaproteobacteria bacterium]MBW2044625.1 thiolase family protein [Deltaproteobacteria bacterium]
MTGLRGKVAIVGIGEVPTGRFPETAAIYHAIESARRAIKDAGIKKEEIDFVMPTAALFSPQFNTELVTSRIVEELGLVNCKKNCQVFSGGSSGSCGLQMAGSLIVTGAAKYVLYVHADRLGTGVNLQEGIDLFSTAGISAEWEVPYGQHYSAIAALTTTRYKFETGCTDEQLAAVCVSNRKWAELNPNAFFKKPLTIEEVLSSKMLSTPLRAKMSNMLFDGGSAFILTSAERAKDLPNKPVYVLGEGGVVTHFVFSQEPDLCRFGWAKAAKEAFGEAGLSAEDIDVAEIYDSYPVYQLIGFEELGFCQRGEAGEIFMRGETWPGGKIPTTTDGGMLSKGHIGAGGGVSLIVEAARQLMGKAGQRQVEGARFAVETGTGGTYMDAQVTILGTEIP